MICVYCVCVCIQIHIGMLQEAQVSSSYICMYTHANTYIRNAPTVSKLSSQFPVMYVNLETHVSKRTECFKKLESLSSRRVRRFPHHSSKDLVLSCSQQICNVHIWVLYLDKKIYSYTYVRVYVQNTDLAANFDVITGVCIYACTHVHTDTWHTCHST